MNQIINGLTPQDFNRPMDPALFAQWKDSMQASAGAGRTSLILLVAGLALMLLLGGLIGVILFFVLAIIGLVSAGPKRKALVSAQNALGLTDAELKQVIAQKRVQQKQYR